MGFRTFVDVSGHRLLLEVERVNDCYQATSPDLPGLLVLADSADEVLDLAPAVACALLEAMRAQGTDSHLPWAQR